MAVQPAIFIVDSDAAVRDFIRALLDVAGLTNIRSYESSRRFLDEAPLHDGDVVLLDLNMPPPNGLDVQRELKRRASRVAVVMMSAQANVPTAVKVMQMGAVDFIEKPFSNEALIGSVHRALALIRSHDRGAIRSDDVLRRLDMLTAREREVFDRLVQGWPNKAVALDLKISQRTVEMHRARILDKMQAQNLATLIRMTVDAGLPLGGERK